MDETLELAIESPEGIIDCMLEPQLNDTELFYNVTILYPNIVDGFSKSEVYCYNMRRESKMGDYYFDEGEVSIHPKIKKLETQISKAIVSEQMTNIRH